MKEIRTSEIETSRLRLRMLTYDDLDSLVRLYSDPEVMRYIPGGKIYTRAETDAILDKMIRHWSEHQFGSWAVILRETNTFIGCAGLSYLNQTSDIILDCCLLKRYWKKGLGTEAMKACLDFGFQKLGFQQISAIAKPENTALEHLLSKLGMHHEKDVKIHGSTAKLYTMTKETHLSLKS